MGRESRLNLVAQAAKISNTSREGIVTMEAIIKIYWKNESDGQMPGGRSDFHCIKWTPIGNSISILCKNLEGKKIMTVIPFESIRYFEVEDIEVN